MSNLPYLKVCFLGGFSLDVDDQPQTGINQPQQQSLLAYLMLQTQTPQLRRHIAFLFWPDLSEERAYANLRKALHELRHNCPAITHYLMSTDTTLCWQRLPTFSLDVLEFKHLLNQAQETTNRARTRQWLMQAVEHYRGELLPGCYDDWILPERERLNQSYVHLLHQLVDLLAEQEDYETAIQYASQLRTSDPFREQTYWLLMILYEGRGDRAAALRVYHDCVAMLERELGVDPSPETQAIYERILNRTTLITPSERPPAAIRPTLGHKLIGRQAEWQTLQAAWHKAKQGQPQLVLIQGEAGIGKTHLAEAFLSWARQHDQLTVQTRAYAAEGQLAYSPVIEWLRSPPYANLVSSLEDVWLTECARLLPKILAARPDLSAPPPVSESWQRQHLFEALTRAALTPQKPLLVLLDDLQWADKETLEWLHFLLRFAPSAALLLLGTVRLSEVTADHPLTPLRQQLYRDGRLYEIPLTPLTGAASDELARQIAGSALTAETLAHLRRYAEGVPLFLVEAVRAELDKDEAERWRWSTYTSLPAPNPLPLPSKVYVVIQARLNQLSPGARQLANVAAVIGRSFSLELLALASHNDEESLVQNLDELWQRRIVHEQGAHYDLSHDRIRDVAYAEIPPMQRKRLHRQVAEALTQRHAANLDKVSPQLAYHYEGGGLLSQAVDYYLQAGEAARSVYANDQAGELLNRGIALIEHLPATPQRDQQALSLYMALAVSVRVVKGWTSAELGEAANRALTLSHKLNDTSRRFHLTKALFAHHLVRGDLDQAGQLADQALEIAERDQSDLFFRIAYNDLGVINFFRGKFKLAQTYYKKGFDYFNPEHLDIYKSLVTGDEILPFVVSAHNLWLLGYPDKALKLSWEGVDLAQRLNYPLSQAVALPYLTMLYYFRQEIDYVAKYAEACLAVVTRYNIGYYHQWTNIFLAWTQAWQNPDGARLLNLQNALAEFQAIGVGSRWPLNLSLLAVVYEKAEQVKAGLETINRALSAATRYNENWWNAELYRLRGNLLLLQGDSDPAAEAYQQAIKLAHAQESLSLELRATTSLARLWQAQRRAAPAYEMLTAVYRQFSEGFGTPDLQEAQALLAELKS
jgi:DNA-binding SARP family transcriptional activator/tetratricopeptide (TPR) repeat protein